MSIIISLIRHLAEMYQLDSTLRKCNRASATLEQFSENPKLLAEELRDLLERLEDDLRSEVFLNLQPNQAAKYFLPLRDSDEAAAVFPRVRYNIEESSKCFALECYGASVFHVLQVAEYGVIEVSKLLPVEGNRPGWASLKRLGDLIKEPYIKRADLVKEHSKLLEDVVPLAFVVKDSWRHKLDHVDNQIVWLDTDFSPQVA